MNNNKPNLTRIERLKNEIEDLKIKQEKEIPSLIKEKEKEIREEQDKCDHDFSDNGGHGFYTIECKKCGYAEIM